MKVLIVIILMVSHFVLECCLAQNPSLAGLEGKFIQFRLIGQTFADDSQEIGGGNLLVRWNVNSHAQNFIDQFLLADTMYLVDDITYNRDPCISESEDCQQVIGVERLCKMLNRYTIGPKSITGMEFCLVELSVDVVRMQIIGLMIPNFDLKRKKDPCFVEEKKPTYILKCKGRLNW